MNVHTDPGMYPPGAASGHGPQAETGQPAYLGQRFQVGPFQTQFWAGTSWCGQALRELCALNNILPVMNSEMPGSIIYHNRWVQMDENHSEFLHICLCIIFHAYMDIALETLHTDCTLQYWLPYKILATPLIVVTITRTLSCLILIPNCP
jgi:hypothetical protein